MDNLRSHATPRMIVSDIDGTLLTSQERITPRLRSAISRVVNAGVDFSLATGRPPRWMLPVLDQLPVRPWCVCANGAIVYDSLRDEIVLAKTLSPAQLHEVVVVAQRAAEILPGISLGFGVERAGKSAFDQAGELYVVEPGFTHAWESDEHQILPLEEVLGSPAVKLLIRDPDVASSELYDAIAPNIDPAVAHVSYSWGGGLVEVSPPGVSKRSAIEWILEQNNYDHPITAEDCLVFGDMRNDTEMLRWAGMGVAMGNAEDQVKAVADAISTSNDEDGVARVLENWF